MKKRLFTIAAAAVGLFVMAALVAASIWPVIRVVETGSTPEYPKIQPLYYSADGQRVFEEATASVKALDRWTLKDANKANLTLKAEATAPLVGFTHDIDVRVERVTEFVTRVHIRSASRVGKGDLGQNARNIRALSAELERRLGSVRFDPKSIAKKREEK